MLFDAKLKTRLLKSFAPLLEGVIVRYRTA